MRAVHGRWSSSEAEEEAPGEVNPAWADAAPQDLLPESARWAGAESWGVSDVFA